MATTLSYEYPKASKEEGLVEGYYEGSHAYDIPQSTINNEVAAMLKELKEKPTFNPNLKFDENVHLIWKEEDLENLKILTLDDLKITKTHIKPVGNFGATYPFPLLSQEAIDMMKWETFQPHILEKWGRMPNLSKGATGLDFHVGGHIKSDAPFCYDFFHSKKLQDIVQKITGLKTIPIYNSDVCHTNVSLASLNPEQAKENDVSLQEQLAQQNQLSGDAIPSTLGLHYDSSDLALVVMGDYPEGTVGGETGLVTGDEKIMRVPDPKVGYATLLQGRVIRHVATKPLTNSNRITFVAGLSPADPDKLDSCALTSTRPSVAARMVFDQFYSEWTEFKFLNLEAKLKYHRELCMKEFREGKFFNQSEYIKLCKEMQSYLQGIYSEMEIVHHKPFPPPHFNMPYNELPDYE